MKRRRIKSTPAKSAYRVRLDAEFMAATQQVVDEIEHTDGVAAQVRETHRRVVRELLKRVIDESFCNPATLAWLADMGLFDKDLNSDEILADVFRDWDGE